MAITGCSVFGGASVEEAPFKLVQKEGEFEIRDYAPVIVAQTQASAGLSYKKAGNEAFRKLFDYISGENEAREKISMTAPVVAESSDNSSSEKIAMTAPVTSQKEGDSWRYRFVLPEEYDSVESAPRPLNPDVLLLQTEPQRVATITYSGLSTQTARDSNAQALLSWIESQGLSAQSGLRWAGYNPPWTLPPFRRNEVLVDVSE